MTRFVPIDTTPLRSIESPSPHTGDLAIEAVRSTWASSVAASGLSADRRHADLERELSRVSADWGSQKFLIAGSCMTPAGAVAPLRSLLASYADHLDAVCARHEADIAHEQAEAHFQNTIICKPGQSDSERATWQAHFRTWLTGFDPELVTLADATSPDDLHARLGACGVSLARRIEEAEPVHTKHPGTAIVASAKRLLAALRAAYTFTSRPVGAFSADNPGRRLQRSSPRFDRIANEPAESREARYAAAVRDAGDRDMSNAFAHVARTLHAVTGHAPLADLPAPTPPPPARPPLVAAAPF